MPTTTTVDGMVKRLPKLLRTAKSNWKRRDAELVRANRERLLAICRERRSTGIGNALRNLLMLPTNPFEPDERPNLKPVLIVYLSLVLGGLVLFGYITLRYGATE